MKISYNWLKEFVDINLDPAELAEELSLAGFEVDSVDEITLDLPGVVVGKVVSRDNHPNADRLSVCEVDTGADEYLNIVCGALNVDAGQKVAVATVGAVLPGDFKIRKAKIRGAVSQGMICSEIELGVGDEADGIWVLPEDAEVGKSLADALNFESDAVFDIGVTPNRPDAFCHVGIAREVAAICGKPLVIPEIDLEETAEKIDDHVTVEIEAENGCPRYAARLIRNVKIGNSPDWMARRLEAAGMRPINTIVDITNYVMLETNQPLHAFDYEQIAGSKIIVRESNDGEKFTTLDDKEHTLGAGTVLICDAERPVALGGIMGGQNSEVSDQTKDVLLESAYFAADSIQQSARHLGIRTEASHRFEKGADPEGCVRALDRASALMAELAGGEVAAGVVDAYPKPHTPREIELKPDQINALIGTTLSAEEMGELIARVGFSLKDDVVQVPSYRPDMSQTADVAEEVARLFGYNNIPLPSGVPTPYQSAANEYEDFVSDLKNHLVGIGCSEIATNSMVNKAHWEELTGEAIYPIMNPINSDMDGMRNSLIPSALEVLQYNSNRQMHDLAVFEINTVFQHPGELNMLPGEFTRMAVALTGQREVEGWSANRQVFDFYDIKGVVEYVVDKISLDNIQFITYDNFAVGEHGLQVQHGDRLLGYFGRLSTKLANQFGFEHPVFVAELDVRLLHRLSQGEKRYKDIPKFPRVERDIALTLSAATPVGEVEQSIRKKGGPHLIDITLFDVYSGSQIESGKKSLAFRLRFQSEERTLREEEVNKAMADVLSQLESSYGALLRDK